MNHSAHRRTRTIVQAATVAVLALTAAGCGGSGGSKSSSSGSGTTLEKAVKYAQCMRENGVTNFPDPDNSGKFVIAAGGPNRNTATYKKAQQACKSMQPPGIEDDPATVAHEQQEWLKVAQCMRKNGIQDFPDPQDGKLLVDRKRINVNSPQFKKALAACRDAGNVGGGSENAG